VLGSRGGREGRGSWCPRCWRSCRSWVLCLLLALLVLHPTASILYIYSIGPTEREERTGARAGPTAHSIPRYPAGCPHPAEPMEWVPPPAGPRRAHSPQPSEATGYWVPCSPHGSRGQRGRGGDGELGPQVHPSIILLYRDGPAPLACCRHARGTRPTPRGHHINGWYLPSHGLCRLRGWYPTEATTLMGGTCHPTGSAGSGDGTRREAHSPQPSEATGYWVP